MSADRLYPSIDAPAQMRPEMCPACGSNEVDEHGGSRLSPSLRCLDCGAEFEAT